jgi:hypothetical protein
LCDFCDGSKRKKKQNPVEGNVLNFQQLMYRKFVFKSLIKYSYFHFVLKKFFLLFLNLFAAINHADVPGCGIDGFKTLATLEYIFRLVEIESVDWEILQMEIWSSTMTERLEF